jgi:hypothetical protein
MGWRALTNGALLKAAASRFDVLATLDQSLQFQNQAGNHPLGIVVLITPFNHVAAYRPQFAEIRDLARHTKPGQVNILQIR